MPLPRPCDKDKGGCGKRIEKPRTRQQKLCKECRNKVRKRGNHLKRNPYNLLDRLIEGCGD